MKKPPRACKTCQNDISSLSYRHRYCCEECRAEERRAQHRQNKRVQRGSEIPTEKLCIGCEKVLENRRRSVCRGCRKLRREARDRLRSKSRARKGNYSSVRRVVSEAGVECSVCGWDEGTVDIHHIRGRDVKNPHKRSNLCVLCPNHHRLFHEGKLRLKDLVPLSRQYPNL